MLKDIMMVISDSVEDKYTVKTHTGETREYTLSNLPGYVINWMDKHTMTRDSKLNLIWM